jgi:hypothetical protein
MKMIREISRRAFAGTGTEEAHIGKRWAGRAILTTLFAGLLLATPAVPTRAATDETKPAPIVELAILLDTSNSMDGLIDQARTQLWSIVNEFIKARQNGRAPEVHVALFEYGKSSLKLSDGYIRLIQPLTNDLDRISEDLFALKTNGGDEYCGWVIRDAVTRLNWSTSSDVYRAIFIAGNEPFTQGSVPYAESCKLAIEKGIIVNTIFCGAEAEGSKTRWQDGAVLAEGKYMSIDQNRAVVHFEAPQDKEIARLGSELNKTYIAYGSAGRESSMRQLAQDVNASATPAVSASRAVAKASGNYQNASWDLVDAIKNDTAKLADVKADQLPAEMQKMTEAERAIYVAKKTQERSQLQAQILQLNSERDKYIAAQVNAQNATNTLDSVVNATVREQAARRNFRFE